MFTYLLKLNNTNKYLDSTFFLSYCATCQPIVWMLWSPPSLATSQVGSALHSPHHHECEFYQVTDGLCLPKCSGHFLVFAFLSCDQHWMTIWHFLHLSLFCFKQKQHIYFFQDDFLTFFFSLFAISQTQTHARHSNDA